MRNARSAIAAAAGLVLLAPVAAAQPNEPPRESAGTILDEYDPTGERTNCIDLRELRLNRRHILNDRMILFEGDRDRAFLNVLDGKCPFLEAYGQFRIDTSASRLCNTDTITVLQRQAGAGTQCGLGHFEIYVKAGTK